MSEEPNVKNARVEVGKTPDAETGRPCVTIVRGTPVGAGTSAVKAASNDLRSTTIALGK